MKYYILLTAIFLIIIIFTSGCITNLESAVKTFVKTLPQVNKFFEEYPDADFLIIYLSKEKVNSTELQELCQIEITPRNMWKITIKKNDMQIIAWIEYTADNVICLVKTGKKKPTCEEKIIYAISPSGQCQEFPTACIPSGWAEVTECPSEEEVKDKYKEEPKKECPISCNDDNSCTKEWCNETSNFKCKYEKITPCCGNSKCENTEDCLTCVKDCICQEHKVCAPERQQSDSKGCYTVKCGDGNCDAGENNTNCCSDCPCNNGYNCINNTCTKIVEGVPYCGDGTCNSNETCFTCPDDCGVCKKSIGESCSLGLDCESNYCVHNICRSSSTHCGDSFCDFGESCSSCPSDCGSCTTEYCGNGKCNGNETCSTCPSDCLSSSQVCCNNTIYTGNCCIKSDCSSGQKCLNNQCVAEEAVCGDGTCQSNETCSSCSSDCGECKGQIAEFKLEWSGLIQSNYMIRKIVVADSDNDGLNEIAIASDSDTSLKNIYIYKYIGGTYIKQKEFGSKFRETVAIGDCDNDGLNELALWYNPSSGSDFLHIYKWSGSDYKLNYSISTPGTGTNDATIGDCDNNGLNELILSRIGPGKGTFVYKYENGDYNLKNTVYDDTIYNIFVSDVDYDGKNELILGGYYNPINLRIYSYISNNYQLDWSLSDHTSGLAIGDFDADSKNEIVITSKTPSKLLEYDGTQYNYSNFTEYYSPYSVASGDIDNNGDFELLICGHYIWDAPDPKAKVFDYINGSMQEIWSKDITQQRYYHYGAAIGDVNNDRFGELLFGNDIQQGNLTIYKLITKT